MEAQRTVKMILPLQNESFEDYYTRLSRIKEYEGISWRDIAYMANYYFNESHSESFYRKRFKKQSETETLKNTRFNLDLEMKKAQLSDERVQLSALVRKLSREETLKEIAHDLAKEMSSKKVLELYPVDEEDQSEQQGLLLISDWHYGIDIENCFNSFSPEIARERVKQLRNIVIKKCKKESVTKLTVANLGDMIAGNIHLQLRLNSRIDVLSQTMWVSEIIAEFLNDLQSEIPSISYASVCDNHSRIDPNKNDSLSLESLCRITDWYLRERVPTIQYIDNRFGQDIATFNILGHEIACVHGNKDKQSSAIGTLNNFTATHYDLICTAHEHHFSANEDSDTLLIANGSLMGTDDHAFDLRKNSIPSQNLIIINKHDVMGTLYKINLI